MTNLQKALNDALPFDLDELDPAAKAMLDNSPPEIWSRINAADSHRKIADAYDALADWMRANWKTYFPSLFLKLKTPANISVASLPRSLAFQIQQNACPGIDASAMTPEGIHYGYAPALLAETNFLIEAFTQNSPGDRCVNGILFSEHNLELATFAETIVPLVAAAKSPGPANAFAEELAASPRLVAFERTTPATLAQNARRMDSLAAHQIRTRHHFGLPVCLTASDNKSLRCPVVGVIYCFEQSPDGTINIPIFHAANEDGSLGAPVEARNPEFYYKAR